jgi:hypothetical protein
MAENTELKTGSSATGGTDDKGQNTVVKSSAIGTTGANVVNSPSDIKAGEVQAANTQENKSADTEEKTMYPVKIVKANHEHGGKIIKKDTTIEVDIAEYRWLLENKIGEPGSKDDVGLDVTSKGETIKPESDEDAVKRIEADFAAKQQNKQQG